MPRNTRRDAVAVLDDYIDAGVEGFLNVAAVAQERPADQEVQVALQDTMDELLQLVRLRNGLAEAA